MATARHERPVQEQRLPTAVRPVQYDLTVKTDLEALVFSGSVMIRLAVAQTCTTVTLHAGNHLHISRIILKDGTGSHEAVSRDYNAQQERLTVSFGADVSLQAGNEADLCLTFSADLNERSTGYYKCGYQADGRTQYYAATLMSPAQCRQVFPCFDEPALKAVLRLTLVAKKGLVALGNEAIDSVSEEHDGWVETRFKPTPPIYTDVVAFGVGPFEHIERSCWLPVSKKALPLRFYATRDSIDLCKFQLGMTAELLPLHEDIYHAEYPLSKLDTLVVSDGPGGALENWGLIIGQGIVYLYDETKPDARGKRLCCRIGSHELAHQFFGNLVTFKWYDGLWLNEAFAKLMGEVVVIDKVRPELQSPIWFVAEPLRDALQADALRSSHPIVVPCESGKEALKNFDLISYEKGAAVLRMLAHWIGEAAFFQGVALYIQRHAFGSAVTDDLWRALSETSGLDVAAIMSSWTTAIGFPVITVTESDNSFTVRQNRFLATNDVQPREDDTLWQVPLSIKRIDSAGQTRVDELVLKSRQDHLPLAGCQEAFYKINAETMGFYRVAYPPERLAKLAKEASRPDSKLSLNDKLGLVSDAYALAKSGHGSTPALLELLLQLRDTEEHWLLMQIAAATADMASVWWEQPDQARKTLNSYRIDLFSRALDRIGLDGRAEEPPTHAELRRLLTRELVQADHPELIDELCRRFAVLLNQNDGSQINSDIRAAAFTAAARHGGEQEYAKLLEIHANPPTPTSGLDAVIGLANASTPALQKRTIDMLLTDQVKAVNLMRFVRALADNPATRRATWAWLRENFDAIEQRQRGTFSWQYVFSSPIQWLSSRQDLEDVKRVFADKDTYSTQQWLDQAEDSVISRSGWLERDAQRVEVWLKEHGYWQQT